MRESAEGCSSLICGEEAVPLSSAADVQHKPAKCSVDGNNGQQDTNILASLARLVAIGVQQSSTRDQALLVKRRLVSTVVTWLPSEGQV